MRLRTKKRIWYAFTTLFFALSAITVYGMWGAIDGCVVHYQTASNTTIVQEWKHFESNLAFSTEILWVNNQTARLQLMNWYCFGNQKIDLTQLKDVLYIITGGLAFISFLEFTDFVRSTDEPDPNRLEQLNNWLDKKFGKYREPKPPEPPKKEESNGDSNS